MSLYRENETTGSVYHITDSNSTKLSALPGTADFTIRMFPIRRNEDAINILGAEAGDYVCNIDGDLTNSGNFRQGDQVVWESMTFIVVNKPRYNYSFNHYKLVMRRLK